MEESDRIGRMGEGEGIDGWISFMGPPSSSSSSPSPFLPSVHLVMGEERRKKEGSGEEVIPLSSADCLVVYISPSPSLPSPPTNECRRFFRKGMHHRAYLYASNEGC